MRRTKPNPFNQYTCESCRKKPAVGSFYLKLLCLSCVRELKDDPNYGGIKPVGRRTI